MTWEVALCFLIKIVGLSLRVEGCMGVWGLLCMVGLGKVASLTPLRLLAQVLLSEDFFHDEPGPHQFQNPTWPLD